MADSRQHEVLLNPGDLFVGDAGHRVRTVLGSCVSVTLWSPLRRVGAMSHFMLARRSRPRLAGEAPNGRYADEAIGMMLDMLARSGVLPAECQAKIFGGGAMFPERQTRLMAMSIGRRNGEVARALLQGHGIQVVSESLYGNGHRQIIFDVATGDVWARQIALPDDDLSTQS